jgi:hypothetical protein
MGQYETANILAILSGGRNPQWEEQEDYDGAPAAAGDGVYLEDAVHALVDVKMREEVHRRTARVTVSTLDLAANYTVTINGTACTATGAFADRAEVINDLVSAINGSGIASAVTASATDEDSGISGVDTVKIVGDTEADFTIDISATGTGVLACTADPTTAEMQVYVTYGSSNAPTGWRAPLDCQWTLDKRGFCERFDTAGLDRMYVSLTSIDGAGDGATVTYPNVAVLIGPCVVE